MVTAGKLALVHWSDTQNTPNFADVPSHPFEDIMFGASFVWVAMQAPFSNVFCPLTILTVYNMIHSLRVFSRLKRIKRYCGDQDYPFMEHGYITDGNPNEFKTRIPPSQSSQNCMHKAKNGAEKSTDFACKNIVTAFRRINEIYSIEKRGIWQGCVQSEVGRRLIWLMFGYRELWHSSGRYRFIYRTDGYHQNNSQVSNFAAGRNAERFSDLTRMCFEDRTRALILMSLSMVKCIIVFRPSEYHQIVRCVRRTQTPSHHHRTLHGWRIVWSYYRARTL